MMAYGQTAITEDLCAARDAAGGQVIDEADNVRLPLNGRRSDLCDLCRRRIGRTDDCDCVAGCDGYSSISRIDASLCIEDLREELSVRLAQRVVSETPPSPDLCSCLYHLSPRLSLFIHAQYDAKPLLHPVQPGAQLRRVAETTVSRQFLRRGVRKTSAQQYRRPGRSIEKSIAPLRSFVAEPMRYGVLFLAGNATTSSQPGRGP